MQGVSDPRLGFGLYTWLFLRNIDTVFIEILLKRFIYFLTL